MTIAPADDKLCGFRSRRVPVKRIAIVQSSYIPWKGYFDLINSVDEFVLFDDVQFTRRDWRNRNRIKTSTGPAWLSIPVISKGQFEAPIRDIRVGDRAWAARHWRSFQANYARARHFRKYAEVLESLYLECDESHLSQVNRRFLFAICESPRDQTKLTWSLGLPDSTRQDRFASSNSAGRPEPVSMSPDRRPRRTSIRGGSSRPGIELLYFDYSAYRPYQQLFPPFEHRVTVLESHSERRSRCTALHVEFSDRAAVHRQHALPVGCAPRRVLPSHLGGRPRR